LARPVYSQTNECYCVVDGAWCDWSDWTKCYSEVTSRKRSRRCECPPPVNGGDNCHGIGLRNSLIIIITANEFGDVSKTGGGGDLPYCSHTI